MSDIQEHINSLRPIFAHAAVGDFTQDPPIPESSDPATEELYAGIQIMLEVIRSKIAQLESQTANAEALVASIGEGIIVIDTTGRITHMNSQAESLLGWTSDEANGQSFETIVKLVSEEGTAFNASQRPFQKVLSENTTFKSSDFYAVRKNGNTFAVSLTATPVIIEGTTVGVIDILRDITVEKEINRMKSEFLWLAAHQLRTPLGIVRWNIEYLEKKKLADQVPEIKDYIDQIYSNTLRLTRLVNDLLHGSLIEQGAIQGRPTPIDVVETIESLLAEVRVDAAYKKIAVTFEKPSTAIPPLSIDPVHFQSIIQNILWNGLKYNKENGSLSIGVAEKNQRILITIADTGIGIPIKDQGRIFTRLFRAQNAVDVDANGTGLGLYIAQQFARYWNGTVSFTSVPGEGTIFTVSFPHAIDKATKQA